MERKANVPVWSPCMARCPFVRRPYFGHDANLLAATFAFQSGLHASYSSSLNPFSQCSMCGPLATIRVTFHSPTGLRCPSGDGYNPYAAPAQVRRVLLSLALM